MSFRLYVAAISSIICLPISIIGNIKLYQHRNHSFMRKKSKFIVFGLNCSFIFLQIYAPLIPITLCLSLPSWVGMLFLFLFFSSWWLLLFFLNVRGWILYFNYKWTMAVVQRHWMKIVRSDRTSDDLIIETDRERQRQNDYQNQDRNQERNQRLDLQHYDISNGSNGSSIPSIHSIHSLRASHSWFINNKQRMGNIKFVAPIFGVLHLFGFCLCFVGVVFNIGLILFDNIHDVGTHKHRDIASQEGIRSITGSILMVSSLAVPLVFYALIVCKTPIFRDIYHMHWESKVQTQILAMTVGTVAIGQILIKLASFHTAFIVTVPQLPVLFAAMNFVSTFGIIRKNRKRQKSDKDVHSRSDPVDSPENTKDIRLDQVLANKSALHLFMIHMHSELSCL